MCGKEGCGEDMGAGEAARYRAMLSLCNFLRVWLDLRFAANGSGRMVKPCRNDMEKEVRLAQFLNGVT